MNVSVTIKPEDMPGRPLNRVSCDICGGYVQDLRDINTNRKVLCIPCAKGGYYAFEDKSSC